MPEYAWLVKYNPLAYIIENSVYVIECRWISWQGLVYTIVVAIILFLVGVLLFNKTEKKFIDTV
jgi:lipopolysaccharide transport system permease protein